MEDRTRSLASACAVTWRASSSPLTCPTASPSAIRTIVSSLPFPAACFELCAVALRDDLNSFGTESGLKPERDLTGASEGRGRNDGALTRDDDGGDDDGGVKELAR